MHVRIRIDSLRNSRFIRLSVPIRIYTIDCRVDDDKTHFMAKTVKTDISRND